MAKRRSADGNAESPANEHTQLVEGMVQSSSIDISVVVFDGDQSSTLPPPSGPDIVVLEERPMGLALAFSQLGFAVRPAVTGVEAMSLVAARAPNAVVAGPGDPERRRVLTGALGLRYPHVPVVMVLLKVNRAVVEAVRREGGHAVLGWPLPPAALVYAAIPGSPRAFAAADPITAPLGTSMPTTLVEPAPDAPETLLTRAVVGPAPLQSSLERRALYSADQSAEGSATGAIGHPGSVFASTAQVAPPRAAMSSAAPKSAVAPPRAGSRTRAAPSAVNQSKLGVSDAGAGDGSPSMGTWRPSAQVIDDFDTLNMSRIDLHVTGENHNNVEPAFRTGGVYPKEVKSPREGVRDLLLSLAPLMLDLDGSARFLEELQARKVAGAGAHARTLRAVAALVARLQNRVGEI